ncbi:MAG: DUF4153 domain-containing protein [Verrucomicrobiales bacterium]
METSVPHQVPDSPRTETNAGRMLLTAAWLTIMGDFLFWPAPPGMSLAIFVLMACAAIFLNRPKALFTRSMTVVCALLGASVLQTCIELSFSNILVISLLMLVLIGETSFPALPTRWRRWAEAVCALMVGLRFWKSVRAAFNPMWVRPGPFGRVAGVFIGVGLPTLVLGGLFAVLLGAGNAIFAQLMFEAWALVPGIDFSFGRALLWAVLAVFAMAILRDPTPPPADRIWARDIPAFLPPRDLVVAHWRSVSILLVLNGLFVAANTIDALYLWIDQRLPEGVTYSEFVHNGVHNLIAAVLLSALLLTAIFQQASQVTTSKLLRGLSLAWIAQNVVLIASVLLRLKLYVDAYQLTEQRVYAGCFLVLVTTGFGLLAWRIQSAKSLKWLFSASAISAFALFFIMQFADVAKWVADYNVSRWQHDRSRTLDVTYLGSLGPSASPALINVAKTANRPEAHEAFQKIQQRKIFERQRLADLNWRSWQAREIRHARLLVEGEIRTARP